MGNEIISSWLHGKAKNTIEGYKRDINQFLRFADKPLEEIELQDIQSFVSHLESARMKETTRTRKINAIKSLFQFATEQQLIPRNITAAIKPPKHTPNLAARMLSREEVDLLIKSAPTEQARLFLLITYAVGLRASEACALKWSDFTVRPDGKIQVVILGKGAKLASVLVPRKVWEQMQVLRGSSDVIFGFDRRTGHNLIKQAAKNAGLNDRISLHWLRHALCKHSLEAGAPIHLVRDTMRHASLTSTNFYAISFPDQAANEYLEF